MTDGETERMQRVTVVIGGGEILLNRMLGDYLDGDDRFDAHVAKATTPAGFRAEVLRRGAQWPVGVLADPAGEEWEEVADELRLGDSQFGLVVVTARPTFGKQRRWQHEIADGLHRANGLISLGSDPRHLAGAIEEARRRPGMRGAFWLDEVARHPFAFGRTKAGKGANAIRANERRHEILVMEARGKPRPTIAKRMDIAPDSVRDQINKAEDALGARNEVELGRLAAEKGLLDDLDDFDEPG
jgi:DNA-binding CsgD family transcriptional regulator